MKKIDKIVTHENPHVDEIFAIWLLRSFAQIIFDLLAATWEKMSLPLQPGEWKKYPKCLFVGCGFSPFDEHGTNAKSSTELVANRVLNSEDRKILGSFIDKVGEFDRQAANVKVSLQSVVSALYASGKTVEQVYTWLSSFFQKVYASEKALRQKISVEVDGLGLASEAARITEKYSRLSKEIRVWQSFAFSDCCKFMADEEWEQFGQEALKFKQSQFQEAVKVIEEAKYRRFDSVIGRLSIVSVESDNPQIGPASRYCGHHICVIKNPGGHVQIFTDLKKGIRLHKAAAYIRIAERQERKIEGTLPFTRLTMEGTIEECPQWHVHEGINGAQMYNGTHSYTGVEPTVLTLDQIVNIVVRSLMPKPSLAPTHSDNSMAEAFRNVR